MKFSPASLKILRSLVIALLFFTIIRGGMEISDRLAAEKKKARRKEEPNLPPLVRVEKAQAQNIILSITGYGRVRPARTVTILPQVQGQVIKINPLLKAGNFVAEGEFLVKLDERDYTLALKSVQAQWNSACEQKARLEQEQKNLGNQLKFIEENTLLAKNNWQRSLELQNKGVASQTRRDQDKQSYLSLKNLLIDLQNRINLIPIQMREAQANIDLYDTRRKEQELKIERTTIRAPFAARIQSVHTEIGSLASPNNPLVVLEGSITAEVPAIIALEELEHLFDHPQYRFYFPHLEMAWNAALNNILSNRSGYLGLFSLKERLLKAQVSYQSNNKKYMWTGQVIRMEPMTENNRMVPVIVQISHPWRTRLDQYRPPLQTGQFVTVTLFGEKLHNKIVIPRLAVHQDEVYVVNDGKLEIRRVEIRHKTADKAIIDRGLQSGDAIVISKLSYPVAGMALRTSSGEQK